MICRLILAVAMTFTFGAQAESYLSTQEKLSDFQQLVAAVDNGYGPKLYKQEQGIASLDELVKTYSPLIESSQTDEEFYQLMIKFVAEFKDGHFGIWVPSTYRQVSAYTTDLVGQDVYVTHVIEELLLGDSSVMTTLAKGDQVIAIDGRPVESWLDELSTFVSSGTDRTIRRIASWMLLSRSDQRGNSFKSNQVVVTAIDFETKESKDVLVPLFEIGEKLPPALLAGEAFGKLSLTSFWQDVQNLSTKEMLSAVPKEYLDRNYACSGSTRVAIPENAVMVVESPFVAYYYPTEKGNIGYLRIPHYSPRPEEGEQGIEDIASLRMSQYEYAVKILEQNTVGLIIDQDHNCGGSVAWLEEFLGLFMTAEFEPTKFQLRASREEYLMFKGYLDSFTAGKDTIMYKAVEYIFEKIQYHWLNGDYLTEKVTFNSKAILQPNDVNYTKPIIVLIDEIAGSGGDAFPSMIQGNGRAKLLGTQTSGLGGHVVSLPPLTYSRMNARMTKSLFFRPDGVPVENNGASPDIPYEMTLEDIMTDFVPYREFYTSEILKMVDNQ